MSLACDSACNDDGNKRKYKRTDFRSTPEIDHVHFLRHTGQPRFYTPQNETRNDHMKSKGNDANDKPIGDKRAEDIQCRVYQMHEGCNFEIAV